MPRPSLQKILREHWLMLLTSVVCLTLAVAFIKVGSEVLEGEHKALDHLAREWMRSHHSDTGHQVFSAITHLGDRLVLFPLTLLVAWPLFRGHKWWFVLLVFCGLASAELSSILKNGFETLRPPIGLQHSKSFAFPSGHVVATTTFASILGYLAVRRRIAPFAYIAGGAVAVLLVAISRMYLDMHWFSDVVGGVLIGATFSLGCCALFEWLTLAFTSLHRRRSASRPTPLHVEGARGH